MDYTQLQQYWWFIISLLGAILVLLLFVQGGATLLHQICKNEIEKTIVINSLGRKWEFTFTTLVTFGGAFFASFPLFYSTSFGGAYWVWMAILLCFVVQAVAYEYRTKSGNLLGQKGYETFLLINGFGGIILLGTAIGTLFTGSEFLVDMENMTNTAMPVISQWKGAAMGLEAALNLRNVLLGVTLFWLARSLAAQYFMNNIDDENIFQRAKEQCRINGLLFVLCFVTWLVITLLSRGFAVNPENGEIFMQQYKYAINYIEMPIVGMLLLTGVALYIIGVARSIFKTHCTRGIWFSGAGVILVVLSMLLNVGLNNTAYYPSTYDLQSSLTLANSSSSRVTLEIMSYVSILIPFVAGYIFYAWRAIDRTPITRKEMEGDGHRY